MVTSFDFVSQQHEGSIRGQEASNPLAAQLIGAPINSDKGAGVLSQTLDKVSEANAQILSPDAKLMEHATPRDPASQQKAENLAVNAGLQPGKNVLDDSNKTHEDTNFDPSQHRAMRAQADQNVFG